MTRLTSGGQNVWKILLGSPYKWRCQQLSGVAVCRGPALSLLPCGTRVFLTRGTVVSLVAFDIGSLAWPTTMGAALSCVCLTLPTSGPKFSVRLL